MSHPGKFYKKKHRTDLFEQLLTRTSGVWLRPSLPKFTACPPNRERVHRAPHLQSWKSWDSPGQFFQFREIEGSSSPKTKMLPSSALSACILGVESCNELSSQPRWKKILSPGCRGCSTLLHPPAQGRSRLGNRSSGVSQPSVSLVLGPKIMKPPKHPKKIQCAFGLILGSQFPPVLLHALKALKALGRGQLCEVHLGPSQWIGETMSNPRPLCFRLYFSRNNIPQPPFFPTKPDTCQKLLNSW